MSHVLQNLESEPRLYGVANLPESDGKPMAETPKHVEEILNAYGVLLEHFHAQTEAAVYANIFVYYLNELNAIKRVSPDILVARGIANEERRVYSVEREGKGPDLVIEFTSKSTKKIDLGRKRRIYAWLEVKEYFLFDPLGEYLKPRLQGFTLIGGEYVPMSTGAEAKLHSAVLALDLAVEKNNLRFYDPRTHERLRTHREVEAARRQEALARRHEALARQRAEQQARHEMNSRLLVEEKMQEEIAARQTAEAELTRLREELEALRKTK